MIRRFVNAGTEDIFNGKNSRAARQTCPGGLWRIAARKLDQLDSVDTLGDLKVPPGNRLEALSGGRKGQFSIRINDKYRICFKWESEGPTDVEILDYHR
ncbi:MAG: type II toxin-antitoxin system RelE/ParE family toxin [Gammaproteobacteria bacterium]|nr:type II toxin-antitoxin system RelE/ParE family toxin [Gammaproteobacteria bacterium]